MLDGIDFGSVKFDVGSFHDIASDGACKQTADKFRHFNHGNVVEKTVNRHSQGSQQKSQRKHHDHVGIVQFRNLACCCCFRFIVGVGFQIVVMDQKSSHGSAD